MKTKQFILNISVITLFIFGIVMPFGNQRTFAALAIGTAEDVFSIVTAKDQTGEKRRIQVGDPLHSGEEVSTNFEGFLKLRLLDDTIFTIGPQSVLSLDEYVYDPNTDSGTIKASIIGVFRFITGKIVNTSPQDLEVSLRVGVIGVRGTQVSGEASATRSLVIKEKESGSNTASHDVIVRNEVNGRMIETVIRESGHGSTMTRGNAPSPSFSVSSQDLSRVQTALISPNTDLKLGASFDKVDSVGGGAKAARGSTSRGKPDTTAVEFGAQDTQNLQKKEEES
jgi:hypothetical protein